MLFLIVRDEGLVKTQKDYFDLIIGKITKNEALVLNGKDEEILKDYSVIKNDSIETLLKRNRNEFLNKYFENGRFKSEEFSFIQEQAVVYYLFNDEIYCRRDCGSGYIFIASKLEELYNKQLNVKVDDK